MEHIALALLEALAKFELWDDEIVDPDSAVQALEDAAAEIQQCSSEEIELLRRVAEKAALGAKNAGSLKEHVEFYENVLENLGV